VIEDVAGTPRITSRIEVKSVSLATPVERREHQLWIDVRDSRLAEVRWDGLALDTLTTRQVDQDAKLVAEDYVGHFGGYNRNSHATYLNAELMLYQRP
jgi:hypothetical protein